MSNVLIIILLTGFQEKGCLCFPGKQSKRPFSRKMSAADHQHGN